MSDGAHEVLREQGVAEAEIETALDEAMGTEVLQEYGIAPALLKNNVRSLMHRLCESAEIDIDGEYLRPHGRRRRIGSQLYVEDTELAQELLRHESIETTHGFYRE